MATNRLYNDAQASPVYVSPIYFDGLQSGWSSDWSFGTSLDFDNRYVGATVPARASGGRRSLYVRHQRSWAALRLRRDAPIDTRRAVLLMHVFGDIRDITLSLSTDDSAQSKWLRLSDLNTEPATRGGTNFVANRFAPLRLPLATYGDFEDWNHVILQTRELAETPRAPYYLMVRATPVASVSPFRRRARAATSDEGKLSVGVR
jgi:hypothetical protein